VVDDSRIVPSLRLSIVSTMFNSESYVEEFCRRASAVAQRFGGAFEIILVNDGSPDGSLDVAIGLCRMDPHIRVIDLSRNFGHHKAMMTGLAHAAGELVFLIDSDLEEDPEWLTVFHDTLARERADVVYGVQGRRKGSIVERLTGAVYYAMFNAMLDYPLPRNVITARLMTARYVSQLVRHRDREVCIAALWVITGFKQIPVTVDKKTRRTSSYGFPARVAVMVNAVTSFSSRPLVFIFYLGCAIMATAAMAAALLIWRVLFYRVGVAGYPSLIISVWFLGGVTIFCLGVIGIYLSKIFIETKDRPYTIVRAYYPESSGIEDRAYE
jgi:putative glycosyltransferase